MKKQEIKYLLNTFKNFEIEKRILNSKNESETRDYLIHPFLDILNYDRIDDLNHEYNTRGGKKVDISLNLGGNHPLIFIECKKASSKLSPKNIDQLNSYCNSSDGENVKLAILTNGIIYNFYVENENTNKWNHLEPFFTFNLQEFDNSDLENLVNFMRNKIELKEILKEANDYYYTESFENALFNILNNKDIELITLINKKMGGKRTTPGIQKRISNLINSYSLKNIYDRIVLKDSQTANSGIITTDKELRFFNIVKTLLATSSNIKDVDIDRISYRDFKGQFNILIDSSRQKRVCSLVTNQTDFNLEINGEENIIKLDTIDVASLKKYKKHLVESTINLLY